MDKGTPHSHTPPAFALGVDYGTNSVRALIVDAADGRELGAGVYEYPSGEAGILLDSRDPNLARQNPADYMEGFAAAVRAAVDAAKQDKAFNPQQVVGIGVDTTGSTPLPVDAQGRPLALDERFKDNLAAHAWLWKDHTSYAEAAEITAKARERGEPYLAKCGGAYSSEWFWSKILHCKRTVPEVFAAAHSWVELADFIPAYITGKTRPEAFVRGICAAGHKAMYGQAWGGLPSKEFLASLDPDLAALRGRLFNAAVPSDHVAGKLTAEIADRVGLPTGIPVAVGALDADLGAVGAGIGPGALVKIIGTSTCDMMVAGMDDASMDVPGLCGVVPGSIVPGMLGLEAGQSAVGDIFNWFVSHLTPGKYGAGGEAHEKLTAEAEKLAPGQSGLVALDWNNGNRTVLVDPLLSGLLVGQTLHTTAAEVYRALIEATAFGALTIINRMEEHGVKVDSVINCGGIAEKSPLTMQIYADVTNRPMRLSRSGQTCALGAAIFGAVVGGAHASVGEAQKKMTGLKDIAYRPRPEAVATYAALYRVYKALHDAFGGVERAADLSGVMKELIAIRDRVRKQVG